MHLQSSAVRVWVLLKTKVKLSGTASNLIIKEELVCSTCWASPNQTIRAFPSNLHKFGSLDEFWLPILLLCMQNSG